MFYFQNGPEMETMLINVDSMHTPLRSVHQRQIQHIL